MPLITSGAMYSASVEDEDGSVAMQRTAGDFTDEPSVPTNEFVRKSAMHERVSTMGSWGARGPMSANMRLE